MTIDQYRAEIRRLITRVPASYPKWDVEQTRKFKKAVEAAKKALGAKATLESIRSAHNALATFYS